MEHDVHFDVVLFCLNIIEYLASEADSNLFCSYISKNTVIKTQSSSYSVAFFVKSTSGYDYHIYCFIINECIANRLGNVELCSILHVIYSVEQLNFKFITINGR